LRTLKQITDQLVVRTNSYRCQRCGFGAAHIIGNARVASTGAASSRSIALRAIDMPVDRLVVMFVLAAAGSSLLTIGWMRYARYRRIEDQPGRRRLHADPTPRGGGIAIAIVLLFALAWTSTDVSASRGLAGLAAGVALFAGLGLMDDLFPVPVIAKFLLQLAAAA